MNTIARNYGSGFTDVIPACRQLRSRAPLRLGLAGGGTDLSDYSERYGGAVLNATIDRFAYAHMTFLNADCVRFRASDVGISEELKLSPELATQEGLALHHVVYNRVVRDFLDGKPPSVDVSTTVDAPRGSGLGSSSALVVALLDAYRVAFSLPLGPYDVAALAYEIERHDLGWAGGRQDQYSAAFGGVNFMEFLAHDRVIVNPLRVSRSALNELEAALAICFTGQSRRSDAIIGQQVEGIRSRSTATIDGLHQLKAEAIEMKSALLAGDLAGLAAILDRSWKAKRKTASGVSSPLIKSLYATAMAHGAWAGKVSGAGGGGFMMFVTDPENRYRLVEAIRATGVEAKSCSLHRHRGRGLDREAIRFIVAELEASLAAMAAAAKSQEFIGQIATISATIVAALQQGHKILFAGNGGSAADAQHIAGEIVSRLNYDRAPMAALALTTDTSVLTAVGNDYGFEQVFARQVAGLGQAGDVFVGISTSGRSPNILAAFRTARLKELRTVGFTGAKGGAMADHCELMLNAPSDRTPIIQQLHIIAAHIICGLVESTLFPKG